MGLEMYSGNVLPPDEAYKHVIVVGKLAWMQQKTRLDISFESFTTEFLVYCRTSLPPGDESKWGTCQRNEYMKANQLQAICLFAFLLFSSSFLFYPVFFSCAKE